MNIEKKVKKIIHDQLNSPFSIDAELLNESSIRDDLGADSLDEVELLMVIEMEFDIEIPDKDAEKVKTVGDAVELVQKMLKMKK